MGLISTYLAIMAASSWLWLTAFLVLVFWLYMSHEVSGTYTGTDIASFAAASEAMQTAKAEFVDNRSCKGLVGTDVASFSAASKAMQLNQGFTVAYYDTSIDRTDEKTFIITGAETGIGRMCALLLASRGGRIILACKDVELGKAAKDEILKRTSNEQVVVRHLDLSSLESVRKFANDIIKTEERLDVLVNNAAISCAQSSKTADGLNTIMQVNHFGPFLLTNLLLDLLKKTSPSRIIFVSSITHHLHKFDIKDLNNEKTELPPCRIYFNSKLANILTANYYARILQGTGVTVNSVHPGTTKTQLTTGGCSIMGMLCSLFVNVFGQTPAEGAMTVAYTSSEPTIATITGKHFAQCRESGCVARIVYDKILQEQLFEQSSQLVGLRPEETHF